jgi:hypothetical protein
MRETLAAGFLNSPLSSRSKSLNVGTVFVDFSLPLARASGLVKWTVRVELTSSAGQRRASLTVDVTNLHYEHYGKCLREESLKISVVQLMSDTDIRPLTGTTTSLEIPI